MSTLTRVKGNSLGPANTVVYQYTSEIASNSHVAVTGLVIRTNYFDSVRTSGSGATFKFTGVTTLDKAGNVPDADGYFYDVDGRQFEVLGSPVSVLWFGATGDGVTDDTFAIQAAMDYAAATIIKHVHAPAGTYFVTTQSTVEIKAHDDGTGSAVAYNGSTVANIAAEPIYYQSYCLRIPLINGFTITGAGKEITTFKSNWDSTTYNLTQPILFSVIGSGNHSYCKFTDFTITNAMMGLVSQETFVESNFEKLKFSSVGICMLFWKMERNFFDDIHFFGGVGAGIVLGGFWTTRCDNYTESGGWSDKNKFDNITGQSLVLMNDSNFAELDTYFDTYFFKSINNTTRKYPSGGTGTPATVFPYRGIAGMSIVFNSRYYRPNTSNGIGQLTHMSSSRPPLRLAGIGVLTIDNIYLERVGYADQAVTIPVGDGVIDDPYYVGRYADLVGNGMGSAGGITINALDVNTKCVAVTCVPYGFKGSLVSFKSAGVDSVPLPDTAQVTQLMGLNIERPVTTSHLTTETFELTTSDYVFGAITHTIVQKKLYYAPGVNFNTHTFNSNTLGANETITPEPFVIPPGTTTIDILVDRGSFRRFAGTRQINRIVGSADSAATIAIIGTDTKTVTGGAISITVTINAATGELTIAFSQGSSNIPQPLQVSLLIKNTVLGEWSI